MILFVHFLLLQCLDISRIMRTAYLVDEGERNIYTILNVNVRGLALPVASHGAFSAGIKPTWSSITLITRPTNEKGLSCSILL